MLYINHEKKAIFIHIPKTGGSYIGPTLVKYYGFISYLHIIANRRPDHDFICLTNRFRKVLTNTPLYDNSFFNKIIGILVYCKTSDFLNKACNMTLDKWNTYTKFCFIRNPYDRILSGWKHINIILKKNNNFPEYISQEQVWNKVSDIEYGHIFMSQKTQIQDENGSCGVDIIGRFEHLEEDFRHILSQIGFNKILHVETKQNVSNKNPEAKIVYDVNAIKKINELLADDIVMFHYKKIGV